MNELCEVFFALNGCDVEKSKRRDYVEHPRRSGYRGRHLIFSYECTSSECVLWAELQVRTKLQHAWATAVEMYDLVVENSRLKFNEYENDQGRFFQEASKIIEATESNENESNVDISQSIQCLQSLDSKLHILRTLEASLSAASILGVEPVLSPHAFCLVDINIDEQAISLKELDADNAVRVYFEQEAKRQDDHILVLVNGSSLSQLKEIYPNYFGDISAFLDLMKEKMGA